MCLSGVQRVISITFLRMTIKQRKRMKKINIRSLMYYAVCCGAVRSTILRRSSVLPTVTSMCRRSGSTSTVFVLRGLLCLNSFTALRLCSSAFCLSFHPARDRKLKIWVVFTFAQYWMPDGRSERRSGTDGYHQDLRFHSLELQPHGQVSPQSPVCAG